MFVRVQNHIINITEIRNVTMKEIRKGKFDINICFKDGHDEIWFFGRETEEAEAIFSVLNDACLSYKNN